MEQMMGIEAARAKLGELTENVAAGGAPVVIARRGRASAVLVDRDEYLRFKEHEARAARAELDQLLPEIRAQVEQAGLDPALVTRAFEAVRRL